MLFVGNQNLEIDYFQTLCDGNQPSNGASISKKNGTATTQKDSCGCIAGAWQPDAFPDCENAETQTVKKWLQNQAKLPDRNKQTSNPSIYEYYIGFTAGAREVGGRGGSCPPKI